MTSGHRADDIPLADITAGVEEWLTRNEPLSRAELNTVESRFMRTVGEPARKDSQLPDDHEVTEKNPHMRIASPEAFGVFAAEEDTVLIELDETIDCGEMVGYPAGDSGWAPLLLCVQGPPSHAHDRMEQTLSTIEPLADGELAL
jgi:hypothetical protein